MIHQRVLLVHPHPDLDGPVVGQPAQRGRRTLAVTDLGAKGHLAPG